MKTDPYLADIRVDIAFATDPDATVPAWVDVTDYVKSTPGIQINSYGRGDEYSTPQAATCTFTADNTSGQFVADNPLSQWYPNVEVLRRVRVSARRVNTDGSAVAGNSFADPTFAQGTLVDWASSGNPSPTVSLDGTHTRSAGQAMLVTWAAGNVFFPGPIAILDCVIGRSYFVAVYVYVPTGSPNVQLAVADGSTLTGGAFSSGNNSFVRISATFTALSAQPVVHLLPQGTPTAGQQCWVDDAMYDEGSTVLAFTTTPMRYDPTVANLASPVFDRYTGYISELPTEFPGGGRYSEAQISCVDRFSRLGDDAQLRSMLEEEYLSDSPFAYYTLGEPAGATQVGDTSDNGRGSLAIAQQGVNGTVTFASGTGPPTDALPAPMFAPQDTSNGKYLSGNLGVATDLYSRGHTLEAFFLTSTLNLQTIAYAVGPYGGVLRLSIDVTGHLVGTCLFAGGVTLTSPSVVSDGQTHHAAITESISGTTVTCTLYLDGSAVATGSYVAAYGFLATINQLSIACGLSRVFSGTLSHVAVYDSALAVERLADHAAAGTTGLAGERSDQRIARLARYEDIPADEQQLDVGLSTSIAAADTTGTAPLSAMQAVEATEGGVLFTNMSGKLAFHSRNHRYNAVTVATFTAEDLDPQSRWVRNRAYLLNRCVASRPNGVSVTAVNRASRDRYGERSTTVTLLTTSDNEVVDAANWKANQTAQLTSRLPNLQIDLLTNAGISAGVPAVLALDISTQVALTGLATNAPGGGSTTAYFLEGRSETIAETSWAMTWNTSPAVLSSVWQLDSSAHSQLDSTTRLAY